MPTYKIVGNMVFISFKHKINFCGFDDVQGERKQAIEENMEYIQGLKSWFEKKKKVKVTSLSITPDSLGILCMFEKNKS